MSNQEIKSRYHILHVEVSHGKMKVFVNNN
jgi:hypothetical protein